jgi:uncharacterized membrane protein
VCDAVAPGAQGVERYAPDARTRAVVQMTWRAPRLSRGRSLGRREAMIIILLVVLLLVMMGSVPSWPHSRNWGYYPSGGLGLVLLVLVILLLAGRV